MDQTDTIREEEIKNALRDQFFSAYDATPILGDIDFAVTSRRDDPSQQELFEREWFLWAEAKKGSSHSINDSFIQLILTIGKAHIHEKHMPPTFLGAFDAEKIAFIEFHHIVSVLYQNDFNWNVTPSNHSTKEFKQLKAMLEDTLREHIAKFNLKKDEKELRQFIKKNFRDGRKTDGVAITRNNYLFVFQRWVEEVKPTIGVDWNDIPATRVADFFFADLISRGDYTLRSDLAVVLRGDEYKILEQIMQSGKMLFSECAFNDGMKAYRAFWNKYKRPPRQEAIDIILERRDLLIPHNLRQYQGAFFTPPQWVELSQRYLAEELGEDWQQQYYVWDCCAGTGNLLFGLTEPYRVWASTLDYGDVQVMKNRAEEGELNLLEKHIFRFDFLKDSFDILPASLRAIINDPDKCKRLVIYINPPYAEGDNRNGEGRNGVALSAIQNKYTDFMGYAKREMYIQFMTRVYNELPTSVLANFSKLKNLQAPKLHVFRSHFRAKPSRIFLAPANTFDNVNGDFPIAFYIWHTDSEEQFIHINADVYNEKGEYIGQKTLFPYDNLKLINEWTLSFIDDSKHSFGTIIGIGNDFQNQRTVRIERSHRPWNHQYQWQITASNIIQSSIYLAVRHCIEASWLNDRDQFLFPNNGWQTDYEFQTDCLVYTLFHGQNRISCYSDTNHWIPFTEQEVGAQDNFASHFMSDYLHEKHIVIQNTEAADLFSKPSEQGKTVEICPLDYLSSEAKAVMDAGRELWRYYHSQENTNPNASYYDIRLHFQGTKITKSGKEQMNSDSTDETYTNLHNALKQAMRKLAAHIEPKVYQYGFLK